VSTDSFAIETRRPRHARTRSSRRGSWFIPLFPEAERTHAPSWLIALLYPLAFFGLTGVSLLRQSGVPATNTVWAEDGAIFYEQSRLHDFAHTLITPYAGYLQLGPRLLVQFTRLTPMRDAAAIMAVTGSACVALVCCYVYHASRGVLRPVWSRVLLVAIIILLPLATGEILDNNVNIGWWLFFAAFWALITRPRTTTDAVLAGTVCLLASATEPLVALFLPLALVRILVVRKDIRQEAAVVGLALGLAYQGIGVITASGRASTFAAATARGAAQALGIRVGWGWLSGNDLSNHILTASHPVVWQATGYVFLVLVIGLAFLCRDRATIFFVTTAVAFAVITFIVPVIVRGAGPNLAGGALYIGSRYSATPVLLMWSALIAEVVQLRRMARSRLPRSLPVLACLLLLLPVWILDFRPANLRTAGPPWNQQVSDAVGACTSHPNAEATLRISPSGWDVVLPCRDIS
jgi:hypothetical protein